MRVYGATVLLYQTPESQYFDCIKSVRIVKDKRTLSKSNKEWSSKSNKRNILIEIQCLMHRFLVAFENSTQMEKFFFEYRCYSNIWLSKYDFCIC